MNDYNINSAHNDNFSLSNVAYRVDPMLAERYIRSAAQKELAKAILNSIKVGINNVTSVLSEASALHKKHSTDIYSAV